MDKSAQSSNMSHDMCNKQQLMILKLIDEITNKEYVIKVQKEVYNRAQNGMFLF